MSHIYMKTDRSYPCGFSEADYSPHTIKLFLSGLLKFILFFLPAKRAEIIDGSNKVAISASHFIKAGLHQFKSLAASLHGGTTEHYSKLLHRRMDSQDQI